MKVTVIQVYAPTSNSGDEEIEHFYHEFCTAIEDVPKTDVLIVHGDWNGKVGTDAYEDYLGTVRKFGGGTTNKRGIRMLEFAHYY